MYRGGSSVPMALLSLMSSKSSPGQMAEHCLMINRFKAKRFAQFVSLFSLSPVRSLLSCYLRKSLIHAVFLTQIPAPQAADLSSPPGLSLSSNRQSQCRLSHVPWLSLGLEPSSMTSFLMFFFPSLLKLDDLSPPNLEGWRLQRLPTASRSI